MYVHQVICTCTFQVRHRLNDDWAFGNDVDSRPWDFQAEECALRSAVDRFNNRRYDRGIGGQDRKDVLEGEFEPVDNCINSVLGQVPILLALYTKQYFLA